MQTAMIVVPCHNESQRLQPAVFRQFVTAHNNIQFLFVNDGSRDNTLAILEGLAASDPLHFQVLDLQPNRGKAEAVRQGILQAAQKVARLCWLLGCRFSDTAGCDSAIHVGAKSTQ